MFKNYLLTAIRSASRQKLNTAINLSGLIIGITVCTFIYLWVIDELGKDDFHANGDNLYRIEQDQRGSSRTFHVNIVSRPMGPAIQNEFPDAANTSRYGRIGEILLRQGDVALYNNNARMVDPSFLSMFSFPLYQGDVNTALEDPNSVILTRQFANTLFGTDKDIIGKLISINNNHQMIITGVLENIPQNSSIMFDLLVPYEFSKSIGINSDSWNSNEIVTYVQLLPTADVAEVAEKISALNYIHTAENPDISLLSKTSKGTPDWEATYSLRAVPDIYLTGIFGYTVSNSRMRYIYILSFIGFVVLMLGCINFMNLTISRANQRAYEVGLRKTVGAGRAQLAVQYFGESLGFVLIAAIGSIVVVELLLPSFNAWSGKAIPADFFWNSNIMAGILGLVFMTAIAAGSYPALVLSSFHPRAFLANQLITSPLGQLLRRSTVLAQFVISVVLLVGAGVVYNQTEYMNTVDTGYDTTNLATVRMRGDMNLKFEPFRQQLFQDPHILAVTGSMQHPSFNSANTSSISWSGKNEEDRILIGVNIVDYDFIETMGIEMLEGRAFDRNRISDSANTYIINEEFAKIITNGNGSAIGTTLTRGDEKGVIIGVTRSFKRTSLLNVTEPTVLIPSSSNLTFAFVKLRDNSRESRSALKTAFSTIYPENPFTFKLYDDDLNNRYIAQERLASILRISGGAAILLACLGMFGLASFSAERRLKELAIRKVLGASTRKLFNLLAKEYIYIIALANVIGIPLAYYLSKSWLENFAYRIDIDPIFFFQAGMITLFMAFVAVGHHFKRASSAPPAMVLKSN